VLKSTCCFEKSLKLTTERRDTDKFFFSPVFFLHTHSLSVCKNFYQNISYQSRRASCYAKKKKSFDLDYRLKKINLRLAEEYYNCFLKNFVLDFGIKKIFLLKESTK